MRRSAKSNHNSAKVARLIQKRDVDNLVTVQTERLRKDGVKIIRVKAKDGYDGISYVIERKGSRLFASQLNKYLKKRPYLTFEHPKNIAKKVLYKIPAFDDWSKNMPGSFALEPIYHPEMKRLSSGRRLDPMTRRLFRHGLDPVGVRTRTVTAAWLVGKSNDESKVNIDWLSLAGGTLMPTMLMLMGSNKPPENWVITNVELDEEAIKESEIVTSAYGVTRKNVTSITEDVTNRDVLKKRLQQGSYDVVDMMGLIEYLNDQEVTDLLSFVYELIRERGMIIFGNMRRIHPQLDLHKRGVGWPGVRPRSAGMIIEIISNAGIPLHSVEVYQPTDEVYNIFRILKL